MRKFITIFLIIVILVTITFVVLFNFNSESNDKIYLRIENELSIIIGFSCDNIVSSITPLDDNSSLVFNYLMFENNDLSNAFKIFIDKVIENKIDNKEFKITIFTKNQDNINRIVDLFKEVSLSYQNDYTVNVIDASKEELNIYSNESVKRNASYSEKDILEITEFLYDDINGYIDHKIDLLKGNKEKEIIKNLNGNYFYDFDINNYLWREEYSIYNSNKNSYQVNFNFDDDCSYDIILNLEWNYLLRDGEYNIVEVYNYRYVNKKIEDLEVNFYRYR